MNGTKILLVVLLLVVVLFVVLVLRGPRASTEKDAGSFKPNKHAVMNRLSGVLTPFAPKLAVKSLSPSQKTFDLSSTPKYAVNILPDSSQEFRQANFVVSPARECAHVVYTASGGNVDDQLKIQDSDDPRTRKHPANEFSFIIVKGGGTLLVEGRPPFIPGVCVVLLK